MRSRFGIFTLWLCAVMGLVLSGCGPKPATPIWNLPGLIGQPMDVVQKTLGQPQSEFTVSPSITQSQWTKNGVTLRATWKNSNRRVTSYEIISRDDDHALREGETAELLVPGTLKESDPLYSTEWIEASNRPLFYTGVKVTPAPKTHAVTIRVSGSEGLLQVIYQVSSSAGKSDDIITIPPWETSFNLPDDATVAVSARVAHALNNSPVQIKVEILADGKVVASNSAEGGLASCNYEL